MSFLSQIPSAAYGFMSVALFCGTYIYKGGVDNYEPLNGISFQQLENKVDKSTIDILTKLQLSETEITRKIDRIENDFQVMNCRFCKTEEDVQQARIYEKLNISMSKKKLEIT
jgi:hypothetical protein